MQDSVNKNEIPKLEILKQAVIDANILLHNAVKNASGMDVSWEIYGVLEEADRYLQHVNSQISDRIHLIITNKI